MKLIYCLMILLWPFANMAQTNTPLAIGDKMPDITLSPLLNYPASKSNFSEFKNKLVVFDFMTTGCASCIEALPRFDSLQKAYSDQIQIILVIPESETRVQAFLKRKNIAFLNLPVIAGDTSLAQLFPHTYISHDVLIKNEKVIAITYPEYVVAENIQRILEGKNILMPVKRDITAFQYDQPLLQLNQSIIPDFSFPANSSYSTVTSYLENVPERFTAIRDTTKNILRISMINVPILDLYIRTLYGTQLRSAFISLDIADTDRYTYKEGTGYYHEWLKQNTYCYEGSFPLNYSDSAIKKKISSDLDFYLQLHGEMVKRDVSCWVITKDSSLSSIHKNTKERLPNTVSLDDILFYNNNDYGDIPTLNESGISELWIQGLQKNQYTNIPVLREKLREYGLEITRRNRLIDMLVITENKSN